MEKEENVYEAISMVGQEEKEKSPLGKFKDVDALLQAYNSLQAEFTRRSQRLKELERMGKPSDDKAKPCPDHGEGNPTGSGQEGWPSLGEDEGPDSKTPTEGQFASLAETDETMDGGEKSAVVETGEKILDDNAKPLSTAEDVYLLASRDEKVRLQIIGDYLQSLQDAGAPISKGGVGALLTPPKKAKTLDDASNMALRLFQSAQKNQF